jgi:hypothetical protein
MRTPSRTTRNLAAMLLAAPLLVIGLSGCSTGATSSHPSSDKEQTISAGDWDLKFAECMRSQGIDMPDPSSDGSMKLPAGSGSDTAAAHCTDKIGKRPALSDSERKAAADASQKEMLKMAQCYRDNGINVPDPTEGEGIKIPADVPADLVAKCGGHPGGMHPVQP